MKKFAMLSLFMAASLTLTACCEEEAITETNTKNQTGGMAGMDGMDGMNSGGKTATGDTAAHDDMAEDETESESSDGHGHSGGGGHDHSGALNEDAQARWVWDNQPTAGKQENLDIFIEDRSGNTINEYDVEHTKIMHLIVVSKDLSYFDHIHPEYVGKGKFEIATALPAGGDYQFIADVIPKDEAKATLKNWMFVEGKEAKAVPLVVDKEMTKVVDGKEITLKFDKELKVDQDITMTYSIKDAATKAPITDIVPYLGAPGHVVILDESAAQYVHAHPSDEDVTGPDIDFETKFPSSGKFKVWLQFEHGDKLSTVPFIVNVKP